MAQNPKFFGKTFKLTWSEIVIGLAAILLGLVLLILPSLAADVVICGIGAICIIIGLINVVRYFCLDPRAAIVSMTLAVGLIWIGGGILIICLKNFLISILPIFFGVIILLGGIAKIQFTLSFKRMNAARWYLELIGAVVSIVLGALILLNPFSTALLLMRIIGASLLVEGIQDMISCYRFKKLRDAFFVDGGAR